MVTMGAGLDRHPQSPACPRRKRRNPERRDGPQQGRGERGSWGVAGTLHQLLSFCSAPLPRAGASSLGPAPLKWGWLHRAAVCPPTALP